MIKVCDYRLDASVFKDVRLFCHRFAVPGVGATVCKEDGRHQRS